MMKKFPYRPEIDGIRAIAVMAVLLYHAEFTFRGAVLFKGGYIGVDIFFVISGFLITNILLLSYYKDAGFSYIDFYEKRIRRIIPVLLFVLVISSIVAFLLLLPSNLVDFADSVLATLSFLSNYYFFSAGIEYGAVESMYKPLLHTWSLSVEEQFYIFFPLLLIFLLRHKDRYLISVLLLLFGASLLSSNWLAEAHKDLNYFITTSRAWELLAGVLLAIISRSYEVSHNSWFGRLLPGVGILMILHAILFFDDNTIHPAYTTIVPVFGCVLLLLGSSVKGDVVSLILSSRVLVRIGLLSYSLYLWHFPVYAFGKILYPASGNVEKVVWLLISVVLSVFSYKLIEQPFRSKALVSRRALFASVTFVAVCLVTFCVLIKLNQGVPSRFDQLYMQYGKVNPDNRALRKESWRYLNPTPPAFSSVANKEKVLLIGDSHSKDMFNAFYTNKDLLPGYEFSRFGNEDVKSWFNLAKPNFEKLSANANYRLASTVVIADFMNDKELLNLPIIILRLQKDQKKVVIISKAPVFKGDDVYGTLLDKKIRESMEKNIKLNERTMRGQMYASRNVSLFNPINMKLKKLASRYKLKYLNRHQIQCSFNNKECHVTTDEGRKVYYDHHHLTLNGAKFFGKLAFSHGWNLD